MKTKRKASSINRSSGKRGSMLTVGLDVYGTQFPGVSSKHPCHNMALMTVRYLQMWTDEYLRWNPDDFGGVTVVRLEANQIWIPDIMLFNT